MRRILIKELSERNKHLIVLRSSIEQRAQQLHQRTTNNAIFIYSKRLFLRPESPTRTRSGLRKNFPSALRLRFFEHDLSSKSFPRKKKSGFSNKKGIFMFSFYSRNILAFTERKAAKKGREGVYIKHLFSVSFFSSRVIYLSLPSPPLFHLSPATVSQARLFMLLLHFRVSLAPKALRINLSYRMFSRYMKKERRMKEIN